MSKGYTFLDHTADVKWKATGSDLGQLFLHCGQAMTESMCSEKIGSTMKHSIELSAKRVESLLFDFLNELLFLLEDEHLLFSSFESIEITETYLKAVVLGDDVNDHEMETAIKSATYSDMEILKDENGYKATVVVDL